MDSAQLYQKLLTDAIHKQMIILGPQITLLKVHNVPNLTVSEDGTVASLGPKPEETVTRFLEEFRELSAPLVKKTMQPLLSALGPGVTPVTVQPNPLPENSVDQKVSTPGIQNVSSSGNQNNQIH
jgi:hypothetical protein